ncbi:MAG: aminopeptidase [Erysipelotrichaceae bacterium]|nr:aminopeptidase [Erysipelotrichaceae bacterium]
MINIDKGISIILHDWLNVGKDELIHFITDEAHLKEAEALSRWAYGADAVLKTTILNSQLVQKGEVIESMTDIFCKEDVIIGATDFSFITTNAIQTAVRHGARFLSLPLSCSDGTSLLENDFIQMDPRVTYRDAKRILSVLKGSRSVHVTTARGTDLYFDIEGRTPGYFNGKAGRKGLIGSSSFEVFVAPNEDRTNGVLYLDASFGYIGLVENPVRVVFENGRIVSAESEGGDGQKLLSYIESFNSENMYRAGELGIGLNRISRTRGVSYIEDESAFHTFHIGLGRNRGLGGRQDAAGHFDIVTNDPTITADGKPVMKDGEIVC